MSISNLTSPCQLAKNETFHVGWVFGGNELEIRNHFEFTNDEIRHAIFFYNHEKCIPFTLYLKKHVRKYICKHGLKLHFVSTI